MGILKDGLARPVIPRWDALPLTAKGWRGGVVSVTGEGKGKSGRWELGARGRGETDNRLFAVCVSSLRRIKQVTAYIFRRERVASATLPAKGIRISMLLLVIDLLMLV